MRPSRTPFAALLVLLLSVASLLIVAEPATAEGTWPWPVEGEVITLYENGDDPYAAGQHRGIDIAADSGDPVRAATAGTVTFAGTVGSAGLTVAIRTADGRFDTSYLHLDSAEVSAGDDVEPGVEIGAVGTTGQRSAEEAHLHFGVRVAGEDHAYRDPLDLLGAPGTAPPVAPADPLLPPRRSAPRPAPAPVAAPRLAPAPSPRAAPVTRPVLRPAPALRPVPAPLARPAPRPAAQPHPSAGPGTVPHPARGPEPVPAPGTGPKGSTAPDPAQGPAGLAQGPESTRAATPVEPSAPGLETGLVLAVIGVAVAAAALLRPGARRGSAEGKRGAASRGRATRLGSALGPVSWHRP